MKSQSKKAAFLTVAAFLLPVIVMFKEKIIELVMPNKTPQKRIYDTLLNHGISPELGLLIVAQTKHETAGYTSNVFNTLNNIGGYKYVGQSIAINGTQSPEGNAYAKYKSIEDSAIDLAGWYNRRIKTFAAIKKGDTDSFANALKTYGYYTNPVSEYKKGLSHYYTETV